MSEDTQKVFNALADTTRRTILDRLTTQGAHTATQLSNDMNMTRQGVTKHINILMDAGLIATNKQGREVYYEVTPKPLAKATQWITHIEAEWDKRLAALQNLVEEDSE